MSNSLHDAPPESAFKRRLSAGFTLLELSIVLVIIGLLIGGVFVGQSLIHNAQLNAVIQEYGRYQTAVLSFKQTYNGLPGDVTNAGQIWGYANAAPATCRTTASTTTATCDGNGDGVVVDNGASSYEEFRFWQHLANAKMIEGTYNGTHVASSQVGVNTPASKYAPAGFSVYPGPYLGTGNAEWFGADYGTDHVFIVGGSNSGGGDVTDQPIVTTKDAWTIDKKIDDGKPGMGNVIAGEWSTCTNAASSSDLGTTYKLSTATPGCSLVFVANF